MAEYKHMDMSDESRDRERAKALGFELRQIIQADRMAMDILQNAEYTRKDIEKKTQEETAAILADAKEKLGEATRQAKQAHAEEMARRKSEAEKAFQQQRDHLESHFAKNRDAWADRITDVIIKDEAGGVSL